MMKNFSKIGLNLIVLSLLLFSFSCKFPKDKIEEFKLNIDGQLINPLVQVKINLEDSALAEKLHFHISGEDAKWFFDAEGKTNFNAEGGMLYLVLHPDATPSPQNPLKITLHAGKEGYLPIRQELVISSNTNKLIFNLTLKKLSSASAGTSSKIEMLNILGKKRIDTVLFNFMRTDGVFFTFKMPTKGLVFLRSSSYKVMSGENKYFLNEVLENNTAIVPNLPNEKYPSILSIVNQNTPASADKFQLASELIPTSRTYSTNTLVGYDQLTLNAIEEPRNTFDTVVVTNVRAQMVSESVYREFDFVDENGNFNNNIHIFGGDVIGFPELTFYDAKSGTPLTPYYPAGNGGILTEVVLTSNNYKFFAEGLDYSTAKESLFHFKKSMNLLSNNFEIQPDGTYIFRFSNNLLRSKLFLYKNATIGCDFKTLLIKSPNVPINAGFSGNIEVIQPGFNMTVELPFNTLESQILVSSVPNQTTQVIGKINHIYQSCSGNGLIYNETIDNFKVCEDINIQREIVIPFNGLTYLNSIPKLIDMNASARVTCPSGNFAVPPTIDLVFWKQGCSQRSQIRVENGEFTGNNFIVDKSNYIMRYDRISSAGKPISVYDTLFFDSSVPDLFVEDNVRGYWRGNLKYTADEGFKLELVLDNGKLKYPIPNCK